MADEEKTLYTDLTHVFCPAEPTKNCPRGQPQDNSALHGKINSCKDLRGPPYLEGEPFGARDWLLLWLSLIPRSQKGWFMFFFFFFFHSALSLPPCLFTEALLTKD